MSKGRRTNNRHKRKRVPDHGELASRGTQAGTLTKDWSGPSLTETATPTRHTREHPLARSAPPSRPNFGLLERVRSVFRHRSR